MRVNRGSIGGLIGVHVSSIVKWSYQDNLKPVYFLYEKINKEEEIAIILGSLNNIKDFATSFPSVTLDTMKLLLWKKILSLTLFKIISVMRTSTLHIVFFTRGLRCSTKRGTGEGCRQSGTKNWASLVRWMSPPPPTQKLSPTPFDHALPRPSLGCRPHIEKKSLLLKKYL